MADLPKEEEREAAGNQKWRRRTLIVLSLLSLYLLAAYVLIPLGWEAYAHRHPSFDDNPRITQTGDGHPGDPLERGTNWNAGSSREHHAGGKMVPCRRAGAAQRSEDRRRHAFSHARMTKLQLVGCTCSAARKTSRSNSRWAITPVSATTCDSGRRPTWMPTAAPCGLAQPRMTSTWGSAIQPDRLRTTSRPTWTPSATT